MASAKPEDPVHATPADTTEAVNAFMKNLVHPFKEEIEVIRKAILEAAPDIREGIKWNAPSFRTTEYFATMNLREKVGVGLILHLGAKVKSVPAGGLGIQDPGRMLKWLGKDRAAVVFKDKKDLATRKSALAALIRQWVRHV
jgi:hypothetical protein